MIKEIERLKRKENAVILAHNYQRPEIQEIADFIGDSLELCIKASETDYEIIVFCGVDFMAETASILNPEKLVLIPDKNARCPMAAMLPREEILRAKNEHPDKKVVLYINTLAEAKAEADIICTSSNCIEVINSLNGGILFGPDKNLAYYVKLQTNQEIIPIPKNGYCYVHKMFSPFDVLKFRENYPQAEILAHPECDLEVQQLSDFIYSTGKMVKHVKNSNKDYFVIATEVGLVDRLRRECPDKKIYPCLSKAICKTMKLHNLEKVYRVLKNKENIVNVDEDIKEKAKKAIDKMLNLR